MESSLIGFSYLVASVCFILTLQFLSSPKFARRGVLIGVFGMAVAVVGTLLKPEIVVYKWIIPGVLIGSLIGGAMSAWIPMTKMPERIALSHAFGGLAAALVGISEYIRHDPHELSAVTLTALGFETFFGFLTFTGSLMAFGKLQGLISGAPITFPGLNAINIAAFVGSLVGLVVFVGHPEMANVFYGICAVGIVIGVTAVIPIGGVHVSRSLRRDMRRAPFTLTFDGDFRRVMEGCAASRPGREKTWISPQFISAYTRLHALGYAHSVEVWRGEALAGGLYGVSIGGFFAGESMFSEERSASKAALVAMEERLRTCGFVLFDVQMMTAHLQSMGAVEVPRADYLALLGSAVGLPVTFTP